MPDWLWAIIYYVPTVIIGTLLGIVGSLGNGIGCIFGSESACGSFPEYFMLIVRLGPPLVGMVLLAHVVVYPRASLQKLRKTVAWLHYVFVPHPVSEALRERGTVESPRSIDRKKLFKGLHGDGRSWWMPEFVMRNRARKVALHTEELRVEAELMNQVFERERARGSAEEAKKR